MVTTYMAEQAGEAPIKSFNHLKTSFNSLNGAYADIKFPDSTNGNGTAYNLKPVAKEWIQLTLTGKNKRLSLFDFRKENHEIILITCQKKVISNITAVSYA
ncbi:unnamed protein product [Rotaria sp. Silwood1]|nr:unnamed protein product [Rotaria sp. Silwood1]